MASLDNDIYQHYVSRFGDLAFDKQLHFASRLYLWSGDDFGRQKLAELRPQVTSNDRPDAALRAVYHEATSTIFHGSKNAAALREPFFQRYPEIRPLAMVLFRLTFLDSIYGLDARNTFFELFYKAKTEDLLSRLMADDEAVAILSTHAINVFYLYNRVVLGNDEILNPQRFLEIGQQQYADNPVHLQLYIYLYTHCIIGESRFYARKLPSHYLPVYQQMIRELERSIGDHFDSINLDNKFEFLVCCKLVGIESVLAERIEREAERSISPDGTYLIDTHNSNPQTANTTLDASEHRNVLFLLAHRTFAPTSKTL